VFFLAYRIGIDGGKTKTLGILINEKGDILGRKETGPLSLSSYDHCF